MSLTLRRHEVLPWRATNMLRGKTARQDHENYTLSLMFYRRVCDQRPKLDVAIANVVGPPA
jgi:type I restriction enzyme M protein